MFFRILNITKKRGRCQNIGTPGHKDRLASTICVPERYLISCLSSSDSQSTVTFVYVAMSASSMRCREEVELLSKSLIIWLVCVFSPFQVISDFSPVNFLSC